MDVKYDVRAEEAGWTVYDRRTGAPAVIEGRVLTGLRRECAERLADDLNEPGCIGWRNVSIIGP